MVPNCFNKNCYPMTDTQVINHAGYQCHRDYFHEKASNTLRVAFSGTSTTSNTLSDGKRDYSTPTLTEDRLQALLGSKMDCEVYSFATMSWISTDLVACMALHVVHHKPDVLVRYNGAGELCVYLTDESDGGSSIFSHDLSHNRRNIGVELWKHRLVNKLFPRIPWLWGCEYLKNKTVRSVEMRNEFNKSMKPRKINNLRRYDDMSPQEDHLGAILTICAALDIPVVIFAFCFANLKPTPLLDNIELRLQIQNRQMEALAEALQARGHKVWYFDGKVKGDVPYDAEHFEDWINFSPKGWGDLPNRLASFLLER